MWQLLWPIVLIVSANTLYNICAKSTPSGINPFASLTLTYTVAAAVSVALFYITAEQKNLLRELGKANWAPLAFGASIVLLEFGYIHLYRAGWKVSVGSLAANISLACVLLIVGLLLYKEAVSLRQLVGMGVCAVGLYLITK